MRAAQAADEPLDEAEDDEDDVEEPDDEADAVADDFVSVPEPEEPEPFEAVEAGVLLDEEPRLSFR